MPERLVGFVVIRMFWTTLDFVNFVEQRQIFENPSSERKRMTTLLQPLPCTSCSYSTVSQIARQSNEIARLFDATLSDYRCSAKGDQMEHSISTDSETPFAAQKSSSVLSRVKRKFLSYNDKRRSNLVSSGIPRAHRKLHASFLVEPLLQKRKN
jgi:hypothetical protein